MSEGKVPAAQKLIKSQLETREVPSPREGYLSRFHVEVFMSNKSNKPKPSRASNQKKKGKKGHKSMRGQGEYYPEPKGRCSISITPTGKALLDKLAAEYGLSRGEFVERIARGVIPICPSDDKQGSS